MTTVKIINGPISFNFYKNFFDKNILLFGDEHLQTKSQQNMNYGNIYDIHTLIYNLSIDRDNEIAIFCEDPHRVFHPIKTLITSDPHVAANTPLENYQFPLLAVREPFRKCANTNNYEHFPNTKYYAFDIRYLKHGETSSDYIHDFFGGMCIYSIHAKLNLETESSLKNMFLYKCGKKNDKVTYEKYHEFIQSVDRKDNKRYDKDDIDFYTNTVWKLIDVLQKMFYQH